MVGPFFGVRMDFNNRKWEKSIARQQALYQRPDDIRTEFGRDFTRILHSTAYRRLKHKTQVFFATQNDHICTRIEHVNHVASVSQTISERLGLNNELVQAIAIGHDLGHAPFGHHGEEVISGLVHKTKSKFWHEKHGLRVVDCIETLAGPDGAECNLGLTYAVRDGIISHCGEVDQNGIKPRRTAVALENIKRKNQFEPYTWEGCVVKVSDKIAYLGRDIEDALTLRLITPMQTRALLKKLRSQLGIRIYSMSNSAIMHSFIVNLCETSNPDTGLCLSPEYLELMKEIKDFNYCEIYKHPRLTHYKEYATLIIHSIFGVLQECDAGEESMEKVRDMYDVYPLLGRYFLEWLMKYSDIGRESKKNPRQWPRGMAAQSRRSNNVLLYRIAHDTNDYNMACLDFIAGMTDKFAERAFKEVTSLS